VLPEGQRVNQHVLQSISPWSFLHPYFAKASDIVIHVLCHAQGYHPISNQLHQPSKMLLHNPT